MNRMLPVVCILLAVSLLAGCAASSKTPQQSGGASGTPPASALKSIKEVVKSSKKYDGLFTLYQDTTDGSIHMSVKKDQIDKEYIYFSVTVDGIVDVGHFRGNYRDNKIFSVRKYFNRIEFVNENTSFYFDKNNALSKAAEANVNNALLASQKIVAQDSAKTEYLIKADDVFIAEHLHQVKPTPNPLARPGTTFSLGTLSKDKSKVVRIKNYPANTDVTVDYVYENPAPLVGGGEDVTDPRFVTITLQHSLIEVPKNDFEVRYDDPRVGYFTQRITDLTSTSATPYRDAINRWNLKKSDPNAALSEPVEPILWWIENTTPTEFRQTIKDATLAWNKAFEAAGFRNAVQVKEQPDDAEWDAGDIRYNVLRWTASPRPPFGGYGPSFTNPRTGQIIGADVMLEYTFITSRLLREGLFSSAALAFDDLHDSSDPRTCSAGAGLQQQLLFGLQAMEAFGTSEMEKSDLVKHSIYYLILHEVGHTLGLNHNMKASYFHSPQEINNKAMTSKTGLMASVMDYPALNFSPNRSNQGEYTITTPGPYDVWAIEFGYSPAVSDWAAEKERLSKILSRSAEPSLIFGNDADDMRAPGKAIDPRVMLFDLSSDPLTYSAQRIGLVQTTMGKIKEKYSKPGQSYHELRTAYLILTGEVASAVTVASRYIGGVYVDRAFVGQAGGTKPFTPVSKADQKRAMNLLAANLFGVNAFKEPAGLYDYLQMQRRGFNFFAISEDPKLHDRVLNIQRNVLNHLLHPNVMTRIVDSRLYGNQYSLSEVMEDLTNSIFKDDLAGTVTSFRQNLQLEYVNRLGGMISPEGKTRYNFAAQSAALYHLKSIERSLKGKSGPNTETSAHTQNVLHTIAMAMEAK
ncbi:MAG: zinc-dependent metalloprotease [Bacteroidota bacterium]